MSQAGGEPRRQRVSARLRDVSNTRFVVRVVTVVALVVLAGACSAEGDDNTIATDVAAWDLESIELGPASASPLPHPPLGAPVVLSDDGSDWAQVGFDQLCFGPVARPDDEQPTCLEASLLDTTSLSWSPDGDRLVVAENPEMRGPGAGVFVIDVPSGTIERLSGQEPGTPPENTTEDWQPFVGPDGDVLAFRDVGEIGAPQLTLHRIGDDGDTTPIDGISLDPDLWPVQPARDIGDGRYLVGVQGPRNDNSLRLIDPTAGTIETIDVGEIRAPQVADTIDGFALVEDRNSFRFLDDQNPFWLISIEGGSRQRLEVPAGDDRTMLVAGFGPDGSFVAAITNGVLDVASPPVLLGATLLDGQLGELVAIADADQLGTDSILGIGLGVELGWRADGRLHLISDEQLITYAASS